MDKSKIAVGISLVAVVIAIIGCFLPVLPSGKSVFGAIATQDVTNTTFPQLTASNGVFITGGGMTNTNGLQSNGGVITAVVRQALVSGTSTPCAIADPLAGTSTVKDFALNITTATSSAITWAVGTSTTAYATTTTMMTQSIAASAQGTIAYAPLSGNTVASGQFIVAGSGSGTTAATGAFGTGILLAGFCQATFQSVN